MALHRKDGSRDALRQHGSRVYEPEGHHHVTTRVIFSPSNNVFRGHHVGTSLAGACPAAAVIRSVEKKGPALAHFVARFLVREYAPNDTIDYLCYCF